MSVFFESFLPKALFLSLTIHTVFMLSSFVRHHNTMASVEKKRGVEISYKHRPQNLDVNERPIKPIQQLDLKNNSLSSTDGSVPVRIAREHKAVSDSFMVERKREHLRSAVMTHRMKVMPIKSAKIDNPAYVVYQNILRSRIRERVYANYRKMEAGRVYLTFAIQSDGTLRASQILEERTEASQNLKDTSMRGLNEAKFPPFPVGMTLPEYTFNIEILYQINE